MKILLIITLFTITSWAQVKIQVVDPDLDTSELETDYQISKEAKTFNSLPDKEVRDAFFDGIKSIKKWDELKKDIFYMDLKSKTLSELSTKYPEVSKQELKFLKDKRD